MNCVVRYEGYNGGQGIFSPSMQTYFAHPELLIFFISNATHISVLADFTVLSFFKIVDFKVDSLNSTDCGKCDFSAILKTVIAILQNVQLAQLPISSSFLSI